MGQLTPEFWEGALTKLANTLKIDRGEQQAPTNRNGEIRHLEKQDTRARTGTDEQKDPREKDQTGRANKKGYSTLRTGDAGPHNWERLKIGKPQAKSTETATKTGTIQKQAIPNLSRDTATQVEPGAPTTRHVETNTAPTPRDTEREQSDSEDTEVTGSSSDSEKHAAAFDLVMEQRRAARRKEDKKKTKKNRRHRGERESEFRERAAALDDHSYDRRTAREREEEEDRLKTDYESLSETQDQTRAKGNETTEHSSSPESLTSSAETNQESRANREERWNRARIISPSAGHNKVLITLGATQVRLPVQGGAEVTMASTRTWSLYTKNRRRIGKPHLAYEEHMRLSEADRETRKSLKDLNGDLLMATGPFVATLNIDGFEVRTDIYITGSPLFQQKIVIGEDLWLPKTINAIHQKEYVNEKSKLIEHTHQVNDRCATRILVNNKRVFALIDTGAGPSVMSLGTYQKLGGKKEDLEKVTSELVAANNSAMVTYGLTELMQFDMGGNTYDIAFTIVDDLGMDDVILGRDFLQRYDVLVDLPKNRVVIRNTKQTYDVRAISNVSSIKARQEFNMKGEEIKLVEFTVSQKKKKGQQVKPDNALWQGCVETTREGKLAQKGAGIGNVLVTVRNGLIHLPVLCANDHRNQEVEIKPKDTQVKIMAVHVTYERRDVEGNKVDYDWVKKNVNHIQVQDFMET